MPTTLTKSQRQENRRKSLDPVAVQQIFDRHNEFQTLRRVTASQAHDFDDDNQMNIEESNIGAFIPQNTLLEGSSSSSSTAAIQYSNDENPDDQNDRLNRSITRSPL